LEFSLFGFKIDEAALVSGVKRGMKERAADGGVTLYDATASGIQLPEETRRVAGFTGLIGG
jgi:hypothetical protein